MCKNHYFQFADYLDSLNNALPDDLLFDTGDGGGLGAATSSAPGGLGIISSSAPTSVVGSIGGPQVVVASGGMPNNSTMNGVTTNSMGGMVTGQPMGVRPGMPINSNPNLLNIGPNGGPKMANGPTGPDGMNNGGMPTMMIQGGAVGGIGGMQPQPINKMMIRQPNNIAVRGGYTIQVSLFLLFIINNLFVNDLCVRI